MGQGAGSVARAPAAHQFVDESGLADPRLAGEHRGLPGGEDLLNPLQKSLPAVGSGQLSVPGGLGEVTLRPGGQLLAQVAVGVFLFGHAGLPNPRLYS